MALTSLLTGGVAGSIPASPTNVASFVSLLPPAISLFAWLLIPLIIRSRERLAGAVAPCVRPFNFGQIAKRAVRNTGAVIVFAPAAARFFRRSAGVRGLRRSGRARRS